MTINMKLRAYVLGAFLLAISPGVVKASDTTRASAILNGVEIFDWMYQIQWLETHAAIDALDATDYDMLVVEPGDNFRDTQYDVGYLVANLKHKQSGVARILLAYIDIGEAESYRDYWLKDQANPDDNWRAPTSTTAGRPSFIVTEDPDGWEGNYPVAYWDPAWQEIWVGTGGIIEKLANYGFHGVYLDWVEAYDDDDVRLAAASQGKNPESEMMLFIERIRNKGKSIDPNFLVISQNAPYLLDADPARYVAAIDALATEDTWFYGIGDAEWDSASAGDQTGGARHEGSYSTANRILQNKKYLALGVPVFTVDYCVSEVNANQTYTNAYANGFIPIVTRVSLTNITETPPPSVAGDMNKDGIVEINDVVSVINVVKDGGGDIAGANCDNSAGQVNNDDVICALDKVLAP